MKNIVLDTDSYKASHWMQYPPDTTHVMSYIESRGGPTDEILFFGLRKILFDLACYVNVADVNIAIAFFEKHGVPFNKSGWRALAQWSYNNDGGLPLEIVAVPEGSVVPTHTPLVTVINTDPRFYWLTSWVETQMLRVWYPITVATKSWMIKKQIKAFLDLTSDDPEGQLPFKLHDFGSRGVSSEESAKIGGMAHLVNFLGSDTVVAVAEVAKYYNTNEYMPGFSIPAAEHSTITSWGRDGEEDAYRNMLDKFAKPGGILAVVSDSYDIYNACENLWGGSLKQQVIDSGATVVIRPDSGNPPVVVSKCLEILAGKFGFTVNSKGYKVLNNVRLIQGDGVDEFSIREILIRMQDARFSADNIAFGMGGALLQKCNRDTYKFAMKCSAIVRDGVTVDVYKDPVTDPGKTSKRGMVTVPNGRVVYRDGLVLDDDSWNTIRDRCSV